jgi:RNA polymerase sigma-70 factor (ECF subfamily)
MQATDDSLVRAVLNGDRTAFAQLYDRYAPLIRAICAETTGNLADAQDLAQEVFLRAYERLDELRQPERFGAWLVSFARRIGFEWCRSQGRERRKLRELTTHGHGNTSPEYDREALELLQLAIAQLPEKERMAVHLFYLQEQHSEEARSVLGLSRSGFYRALERARSRLKSILCRNKEITR